MARVSLTRGQKDGSECVWQDRWQGGEARAAGNAGNEDPDLGDAGQTVGIERMVGHEDWRRGVGESGDRSISKGGRRWPQRPNKGIWTLFFEQQDVSYDFQDASGQKEWCGGMTQVCSVPMFYPAGCWVLRGPLCPSTPGIR